MIDGRRLEVAVAQAGDRDRPRLDVALNGELDLDRFTPLGDDEVVGRLMQ